MKRFLKRTLLGFSCLALVLTLTLVTASTVEASATKCNSHSCVHVFGKGLYVEYIEGGLEFSSGAAVEGHVELWGPGFHYNSEDQFYSFQSAERSQDAYTEPRWALHVPIYRDLPDKSLVCARFWQKKAHGGYSGGETACAKIHR